MELKEAYNVKELVAELEVLGLNVAEDTAVKLLDIMLEWAAKSAAKSSTPYDDLLASVLPMFKTEILKHIDKINGKEG